MTVLDNELELELESFETIDSPETIDGRRSRYFRARGELKLRMIQPAIEEPLEFKSPCGRRHRDRCRGPCKGGAHRKKPGQQLGKRLW